MTTNKNFCDYVLAQLDKLGDIRLRPMMGEYLLYYRDVLVGGLYDERLLLKEVPSTAKYQFEQVIPYTGAKRTMYYVEDLENTDKLYEIILATYNALPKKNSGSI